MTDQPFLDDLEQELRAAHPRRRAARRRAAAGRAARRAPAALAVVAVLGGAIALTGALDGSGGPAPDRGVAPAAPASPALQGVPVAVLNGTTIGGLARRVGDRLQDAGARLGTITNGPDPTVRRTRVLYAAGAEDAATRVAAVVGTGLFGPLDRATREVAGDADVVVVAGGDLTFPAAGVVTSVGCPKVGAEQTAPRVVAGRDAAAGPLAVLGALDTPGRERDAFGRRGYKLAVTVADGEIATLRVPRALRGRVGLVYTLRDQSAVERKGVRGAASVVDFAACSARPGGSPRTGWAGGIVTDRPRCAELLVKVLGEARSRRLRVPLGRAC